VARIWKLIVDEAKLYSNINKKNKNKKSYDDVSSFTNSSLPTLPSSLASRTAALNASLLPFSTSTENKPSTGIKMQAKINALQYLIFPVLSPIAPVMRGPIYIENESVIIAYILVVHHKKNSAYAYPATTSLGNQEHGKHFVFAANRNQLGESTSRVW